MSSTTSTMSVVSIAGSHRGMIVDRADSIVSTGAPTSMPAATVACPARTAVSQAGCVVKPRSGRHSCEYSHSPSCSFATDARVEAEVDVRHRTHRVHPRAPARSPAASASRPMRLQLELQPRAVEHERGGPPGMARRPEAERESAGRVAEQDQRPSGCPDADPSSPWPIAASAASMSAS